MIKALKRKDLTPEIGSLVAGQQEAELKVTESGEVIRVSFHGCIDMAGKPFIVMKRHSGFWSSDNLSRGQNLTVSWTSEEGIFSFKSCSLSEEGADGLIRIMLPKKISRAQKRQYIRVPTPPSPPARPFNAFIENGKEKFEFLVEDISAGGMAVLTCIDSGILYEGIKLKGFQFQLPDDYLVSTDSIVRYLYPTSHEDTQKRHRCGVMFADISIRDREKVIKYVFARQREIIREQKKHLL